MCVCVFFQKKEEEVAMIIMNKWYLSVTMMFIELFRIDYVFNAGVKQQVAANQRCMLHKYMITWQYTSVIVLIEIVSFCSQKMIICFNGDNDIYFIGRVY